MAQITRNRTIRPSSRLKSSTNYKIDTKKVKSQDILVVNISHETKPYKASYTFEGKDLLVKNSIHFKVFETENSIEIKWIGIMPLHK